MSSTAEKEKEKAELLPVFQITQVQTLRPELGCWWLLGRLSQEAEAGSGEVSQEGGCTESGDRGAQRRLGRSRDSLRNWDHASEPPRPRGGRPGAPWAARISPGAARATLRGVAPQPLRAAGAAAGSARAGPCPAAQAAPGPVPAWVPGSRKRFRKMSWDQHPSGVWRRAAGAEGELSSAAMQFLGRRSRALRML